MGFGPGYNAAGVFDAGAGANGAPIGSHRGIVYGSPVSQFIGQQRDTGYDAQDGQPRGASPFNFTGFAQDGFGNFSFGTSLSQMQVAAQAADQAKFASITSASTSQGLRFGQAPDTALPDSLRVGGLGITASPPVAKSGPGVGSTDIWVEGTGSYFVDNLAGSKFQGNAALLHTGVDTIVRPGLLVGVMGSFDWMSQTSPLGGGNNEGHGWMAGPYLSARLTSNVYFDARAEWGQSSNQINPLGAYTDSFSTERMLASAKLTGDWLFENLRFRPSAEIIWFDEAMKQYTDALGIDIGSQNSTLGRAIFGPEVGYSFRFADKSAFEPFLGISGVWDFAKAQETTADGTPIAGDTFRGRITAGASYRDSSGISVRLSGAYDGIGSASNYHAYQGQAFVVVPLH